MSISDQAYTQGCAPSVLILFINMMLFSSNEPEAGCKEFMFEGQGSIQRVFVLVGLCCIPIMLLGKPLYLLAASKKKHAKVIINLDIIHLQLSYFVIISGGTTTDKGGHYYVNNLN